MFRLFDFLRHRVSQVLQLICNLGAVIFRDSFWAILSLDPSGSLSFSFLPSFLSRLLFLPFSAFVLCLQSCFTHSFAVRSPRFTILSCRIPPLTESHQTEAGNTVPPRSRTLGRRALNKLLCSCFNSNAYSPGRCAVCPMHSPYITSFPAA